MKAKKKSKKRTLTESFDLLLYSLWADCGKQKKYAKFKEAIEVASDVLHRYTDKASKRRKK